MFRKQKRLKINDIRKKLENNSNLYLRKAEGKK